MLDFCHNILNFVIQIFALVFSKQCLFDIAHDYTCDIVKLFKQLLMILSLRLLLSSQSIISLGSYGRQCLCIKNYLWHYCKCNRLYFNSITDQSFNVLKNIVLLCFQIWKEVPSNLRM